MAARFMNALGASELERTICATAGIAGTLQTHGVSPEVDPEEWPNARYLLVWGWNPLSTAPHLWRKLLEARAQRRAAGGRRSRSAAARRGVADEHLRPLPGTDAALALGMMRAIVDAGLADEEWCRAHADGYDELLERLGEHPVEDWAAICGVAGRGRSPEIAREFATTQPALLRLGVGAQRHLGAPIAYRTIACLPALVGRWRHRGGGCSYIPTATASAISDARAPAARTCARGRCATINMSQLGEALTDPALDPPVKALVVWSSNPAPIAPDQERVLAGPAPRGPVHGRDRAVHDRHRRPRRRRPARDHPARAPRRAVLVGASLLHAQRAGDRAARRGEADHRGVPAARRRMGFDDPASADSDEELLAQLLERRPAASRSTRCASAAGRRSISARARRRTPRAASAPRPASSGCAPTGSPTPASTRCRSSTRRPRSPTTRSPSASRSRCSPRRRTCS